MLRDGTAFKDLRAHHFDQVDRPRAAQSLVRRLQRLGSDLNLTERAA
jgi:hypothetical protein